MEYLLRFSLRLILLFLFLSFSLPSFAQHDKHDKHKKDKHEHHKHGKHHKHHNAEKLREYRFTSDFEDITKYGKWETVVPEAGGGAIHSSLGMQTVHTMLLPSGKVLFASGSSWRNLAPMEYYPQFPNPTPGQGLFNRYKDPFNKLNVEDYYQLVNNTGIFDVEENTFYRVPSPYPKKDSVTGDHFIPNDFFCTGHIQLPNGNPFFVGGTQYYYPYRTGTNTSYIFDWRKELTIDWQEVDWRILPDSVFHKDYTDAPNYPWIFSGLMKRGRWYPTLVPLLDGRFAIFSGYVGFDKGFPDMYQFELNHYVEFFDPNVFDKKNPQKSWKSIDVKKLPNSPFSTKLEWPNTIVDGGICYDFDFLDDFGFDVHAENFEVPCKCPPRCVKDHQFDAFKLYPHNYLFDGTKIYLTREGEWVSLRTANTEYMRRTRFTYWMNLEGTAKNPSVTFEKGALRADTSMNYGTSFLDPNSGNIVLLGGQQASPGTLLPIGAENPNHFAGGRGSRDLEQYNFGVDGTKGSWSLVKDYLGKSKEDDRTMHFAIILPTRQILIINGANYDFYGAVLHPILLTPQFDERGNFTSYNQERMAEAVEPRLYHNTAILVPDGRILVSGGNSARATVSLGANEPKSPMYKGQPLPNHDLVELDLYFYTDGQVAKQPKGASVTPTENWTAEFFSPPYLFIDSTRRVTIDDISKDVVGKSNVTFKKNIGGKDFYLFQSNETYTLELSGLPTERFTGEQSLVLLKLPSATHGGQFGQHFVELPIITTKDDQVVFKTPSAKEENVPPGFYMLFYVDSRGKPSFSQMIRFDDKATAP